MIKNVYKDSGIRIPIQVNSDGVPLCVCCGVPMVEVDPGYWQCSAFAAPMSPTAGSDA